MEFSVDREKVADLSEWLLTKQNFDLERCREGAILLFDKPVPWSSFKLVKKVKYFTRANRVGHAGTLDPLASGLMIICTGKCTKMIEEIQNQSKEYTGIFRLGKTTPSYDLESAFDAEYPVEHITNIEVEKAVQHFSGDVVQVPPAFSAVKINGTRAYKMARNGEEVKIKERTIQIHNFEVKGEVPDLQFKVNCSKGTYIRTLANDFGKFLNSGAYLDELRRTAIGDFKVENAFDIDEFKGICGF